MLEEYEKAFDRVKHAKIIECKENVDTDGKYISLIRNLYWNQKAYIRTEDGLSPEIHIKGEVEYDKAVCYDPVCLICTQNTSLGQLIPTKADLQKPKRQGHDHLCDSGMPARNGNLGNDRTTTTKAASMRKQQGTKHNKSNEGRQVKNGGVKGRYGGAEELDRETGDGQTTVGRTRRKDGG